MYHIAHETAISGNPHTHTLCQTDSSLTKNARLQTHLLSKYCDHRKTACPYICVKT